MESKVYVNNIEFLHDHKMRENHRSAKGWETKNQNDARHVKDAAMSHEEHAFINVIARRYHSEYKEKPWGLLNPGTLKEINPVMMDQWKEEYNNDLSSRGKVNEERGQKNSTTPTDKLLRKPETQNCLESAGMYNHLWISYFIFQTPLNFF